MAAAGGSTVALPLAAVRSVAPPSAVLRTLDTRHTIRPKRQGREASAQPMGRKPHPLRAQ